MTAPETPPHSRDAEDVARALRVDPAVGLTSDEVAARRERFGRNELQRAPRRSVGSILAAQFKGLIVALLAAAAVASFAIGETVEGLAVACVLAINGAIGFYTELRAVRSMEGLRRLGRSTVTVRRDGGLVRRPAEDLVPGDVVVLEAGDVVTADLRLVVASGVQADESTLTGESLPVEKDAAAVAENAPLADRTGMLFKGTALTGGSGEGVVVATGMHTELGRITALVQESVDGETPLERRLDRLGRTLAWLSLAFVLAVVVAGVIGGGDPWLLVRTGVALAVATVPEGLPIVATLALARGMWRMARRHALVEELPAVETLGSTDVVLTDKTGTLTENRMTVERLVLADGDVEIEGAGLDLDGRLLRDGAPLEGEPEARARTALRAGAICTTAELDASGPEARGVGDPMEVALLVAAHKAGLTAGALAEDTRIEHAVAFDPARKMMATFHRRGDELHVAVKGAPEAVMDACDRIAGPGGERPFDAAARSAVEERLDALLARGLRVLAVAERQAQSVDDDPYAQLVLLGLVGLVDPPRTEVRAAIEACRAASIRVVMVTGDHAGTAAAVARAVGLVEGGEAPTDVVLGAEIRAPDELDPAETERILGAPVIARCSPEQKLHLLALHQRSGHVVAMIGDGVNDAPALRRADIGVAMGERGTEVAREAAAMVLQDDDFRTIPVAIEQGRVIYENIRRFVVYLVSCNLSEILTVGLAALASAPLPILPMQILFLNLVTDVFPALALAAGEGDEAVMQRPPRPSGEPLLTRRQLRTIFGFGGLLAASVLGAFAYAHLILELDPARAVTVSFLALATAQLWHVFNMATPGSGVWSNEVTRNPYVWGAVALCIVLVALGVHVPPLAGVLGLTPPGPVGWATAIGFGLVPLVVGRLIAAVQRKRAPAGQAPGAPWDPRDSSGPG